MHERFNYNFTSVDPNEAKKSHFIISRLMTYNVVVFSLFKTDVRFIKLLQELKYPKRSHVITDEKLSCHLWTRIVYNLEVQKLSNLCKSSTFIKIP